MDATELGLAVVWSVYGPIRRINIPSWRFWLKNIMLRSPTRLDWRCGHIDRYTYHTIMVAEIQVFTAYYIGF